MRPLSCRCTHLVLSRAERLQRLASCFLSAAVSGDASIVQVEAAGGGGTTLTSAAEPYTRQRQTRSKNGITSVCSPTVVRNCASLVPPPTGSMKKCATAPRVVYRNISVESL